MKKICLSAINFFGSTWVSAYLLHLATPNPETWIQVGAAVSVFFVIILGISTESLILMWEVSL
jgi:hypothetical protein